MASDDKHLERLRAITEEADLITWAVAEIERLRSLVDVYRAELHLDPDPDDTQVYEEQPNIRDVKRWQVESGIFHVVACRQQGYAYTLCEMLTTDNSQSELPTGTGRFKTRICRKCRERLKTARALEADDTQAEEGK